MYSFARMLQIYYVILNTIFTHNLQVFWCAVKTQVHFESVIPRKFAHFFERYVLKKISLVNISPHHGVDSKQLYFVHQMLGGLQVLLKSGLDIDLCEIVISLRKVNIIFSINAENKSKFTSISHSTLRNSLTMATLLNCCLFVQAMVHWICYRDA